MYMSLFQTEQTILDSFRNNIDNNLHLLMIISSAESRLI